MEDGSKAQDLEIRNFAHYSDVVSSESSSFEEWIEKTFVLPYIRHSEHCHLFHDSTTTTTIKKYRF